MTAVDYSYFRLHTIVIVRRKTNTSLFCLCSLKQRVIIELFVVKVAELMALYLKLKKARLM